MGAVLVGIVSVGLQNRERTQRREDETADAVEVSVVDLIAAVLALQLMASVGNTLVHTRPRWGDSQLTAHTSFTLALAELLERATRAHSRIRVAGDGEVVSTADDLLSSAVALMSTLTMEPSTREHHLESVMSAVTTQVDDLRRHLRYQSPGRYLTARRTLPDRWLRKARSR